MNRLPKPSLTGASASLQPLASRYVPRLALVLILLLLGACSGTTFLYNRLNIIIPWYVDSYVDLDREQKRYLGDLLDPFLDWHRNEELSSYVAILDQVTDDLDAPVTAEGVRAVSREFENAWFRLESRGLEWMLDLGEQLSDEQMDEFIESLSDKQQDYEEKYLERTDEEFRRESYDGLKDSLQDYMGRLDSAQRERLERASQELRRSDSVWLTERRAWIERAENMLQREPGWQDEVRQAIARRDDTVSQEYVDTYTHNLEVIHAAIAEVIDSRSEKQDRRLRRELQDLRADLQTLIAQGQAAD